MDNPGDHPPPPLPEQPRLRRTGSGEGPVPIRPEGRGRVRSQRSAGVAGDRSRSGSRTRWTNEGGEMEPHTQPPTFPHTTSHSSSSSTPHQPPHLHSHTSQSSAFLLHHALSHSPHPSHPATPIPGSPSSSPSAPIFLAHQPRILSTGSDTPSPRHSPPLPPSGFNPAPEFPEGLSVGVRGHSPVLTGGHSRSGSASGGVFSPDWAGLGPSLTTPTSSQTSSPTAPVPPAILVRPSFLTRPSLLARAASSSAPSSASASSSHSHHSNPAVPLNPPHSHTHPSHHQRPTRSVGEYEALVLPMERPGARGGRGEQGRGEGSAMHLDQAREDFLARQGGSEGSGSVGAGLTPTREDPPSGERGDEEGYTDGEGERREGHMREREGSGYFSSVQSEEVGRTGLGIVSPGTLLGIGTQGQVMTISPVEKTPTTPTGDVLSPEEEEPSTPKLSIPQDDLLRSPTPTQPFRHNRGESSSSLQEFRFRAAAISAANVAAAKLDPGVTPTGSVSGASMASARGSTSVGDEGEVQEEGGWRAEGRMERITAGQGGAGSVAMGMRQVSAGSSGSGGGGGGGTSHLWDSVWPKAPEVRDPLHPSPAQYQVSPNAPPFPPVFEHSMSTPIIPLQHPPVHPHPIHMNTYPLASSAMHIRSGSASASLPPVFPRTVAPNSPILSHHRAATTGSPRKDSFMNPESWARLQVRQGSYASDSSGSVGRHKSPPGSPRSDGSSKRISSGKSDSGIHTGSGHIRQRSGGSGSGSGSGGSSEEQMGQAGLPNRVKSGSATFVDVAFGAGQSTAGQAPSHPEVELPTTTTQTTLPELALQPPTPDAPLEPGDSSPPLALPPSVAQAETILILPTSPSHFTPSQDPIQRTDETTMSAASVAVSTQPPPPGQISGSRSPVFQPNRVAVQATSVSNRPGYGRSSSYAHSPVTRPANELLDVAPIRRPRAASGTGTDLPRLTSLIPTSASKETTQAQSRASSSSSVQQLPQAESNATVTLDNPPVGLDPTDSMNFDRIAQSEAAPSSASSGEGATPGYFALPPAIDPPHMDNTLAPDMEGFDEEPAPSHPFASAPIDPDNIGPDETMAVPTDMLPNEIAFEDEGLSTLERIFLLSKSEYAFHRAYAARMLGDFLEDVDPCETVEYVLPLLSAFAMDEDDSVKEAFATNLHRVLWFYFSHCDIIIENDQVISGAEEEEINPPDITTVTSEGIKTVPGSARTDSLESDKQQHSDATLSSIDRRSSILRSASSMTTGSNSTGTETPDSTTPGSFVETPTTTISMGTSPTPPTAHDFRDKHSVDITEEVDPNAELMPRPSIAVHVFTPLLGSMLLSQNPLIADPTRAAVVAIVAKLRGQEVASAEAWHTRDSRKTRRTYVSQTGPHSHDLYPFSTKAKKAIEEELLEGIVKGMGRLDAELPEELMEISTPAAPAPALTRTLSNMSAPEDAMDEEEEARNAEIAAFKEQLAQEAALGRAISMNLIASVAEFYPPPDIVEHGFIDEVLRSAEDEVSVKTEGALALAYLAKVVPTEYIDHVLPLFEKFADDDSEQVRQSACLSLPALCKRITDLNHRRAYAINAFRTLMSSGESVQYTALEILGEVIHLFHDDPDGPPNELLEYYLDGSYEVGPEEEPLEPATEGAADSELSSEGASEIVLESELAPAGAPEMAPDATPEPIPAAILDAEPAADSEVEEAAVQDAVPEEVNLPQETLPVRAFDDLDRAVVSAFNFPAVCLTIGPSRWNELRDTYIALQHVDHVRIRRSLAASLHELALILGPAITSMDLLPGFYRYLEDIPEVREKAMANLPVFVANLHRNPDPSSYGNEAIELIDVLSKLWSDGFFSNWRDREILAGQIPKLLEVFVEQSRTGGQEDEAREEEIMIEEANVACLMELLRSALMDTFAAVRGAAVAAMPRCHEVVRSNPLLQNRIFLLLQELSGNENFKMRKAYIACAQSIMLSPSSPLPAMSPSVDGLVERREFFEDYFLDPLITLVEDLLDVRIVLSKLFAVLCGAGGIYAVISTRPIALSRTLETLINDESEYVRSPLSKIAMSSAPLNSPPAPEAVFSPGTESQISDGSSASGNRKIFRRSQGRLRRRAKSVHGLSRHNSDSTVMPSSTPESEGALSGSLDAFALAVGATDRAAVSAPAYLRTQSEEYTITKNGDRRGSGVSVGGSYSAGLEVGKPKGEASQVGARDYFDISFSRAMEELPAEETPVA